MASKIKLTLISESVAKSINQTLPGIPTEDRVVLCVPTGDSISNGGIIIPGTNREDVPKMGVVVKVGHINEAFEDYKELLKIGRVVHFGLYGGKKIEVDTIPPLEEQDIVVLSMSEIIYVEPNKQQ